MRGIKFNIDGLAEVVELEMPRPREGNVLVRITSAGVCGSDLAALRGTHLFRIPPLISGHEGGGIVHEVGEGVTDFVEGDRVVIDPQKPCGECDLCGEGNYHLCPKKVMLGVAEWPGSFADYVEVPAYTLIAAPDSIKDEHLGLAEPIAVAAHAVRQLGERKQKTALVLGGGTIGALIARVLSHNGTEVTVSEPRAFLKEKLEALGAAHVRTPDELGDDTYDAVFVAAGVPELIAIGLDRVGQGGALVQVAVFNLEVPVHVGKLQVKEQAILGTAMYQTQDFATALDLLATYPDIPEILVSAVVSLEEGADMITDMAKNGPGDILKLIMVP